MMNKTPEKPKRRIPRKRIKQTYPRGWNERRVRAVAKYYDELSDEQLAREIEKAPEVTEEKLMLVPAELVPTVQKLIARHQKSA